MPHEFTGRKCFCTAQLNALGKCPHGCDPALRAPFKRRQLNEIAERKNDRRAQSTTQFPSKKQVNRGAEKTLGVAYHALRAEWSRRARQQ